MTEKENNNINHDAFFKKAMEIKQVREEFLKAHLPKDIQASLNFDTLKIEKESFIEKNLKKQFVDVLVSAKNKDNQDSYIYCLLEHQSTPDYWMSFRLLKYMCAIWDKHLAKHKNCRKLPILYPVVLYNGQAKYNAPLSIFDLMENQDIARNVLSHYKLVDLHEISDDEFKKRKWSGLMEYLMKSIHARDFMNKFEAFQDIIKLMITIDPKDGAYYFNFSLNYAIIKIKEKENYQLEKLIKNVLDNQKEAEEIMGTLVQAWKKEGIIEGMQQGIQQGVQQGMQQGIQQGVQQGMQQGIQQGRLEERKQLARKLLEEKLSDSFVQNITGLSSEDIQKIKAQL